ncbi:TylF/MycF/NovP-related O-methyltransferase [Bradyrhizobium sp. LB11.1]|uniref:TylF/MycF/NovP-related O-methyltransferase n=1 Tax=Bradyrhizobium sp. LB11.1 TaxID=3156326 RepID=UPI003393C692
MSSDRADDVPADPATGIRPIAREPWVEIADGAALANWSAEDEIRYNQQNRQSEKLKFFRHVFDFLKENEIAGDYHEFGCHRARTFRMALTEARRKNLGDMAFWAFDSFAGLPAPETETSVGKWTQGALATSEQEFLRLIGEHGIYTSQVRTVKGLYGDSLTPALKQQFTESGRRIALANIDCDLYESAIPVFDFIEPLLQAGSVLYIDDLFVGNRGNPGRGLARAFVEYRQRSRWRFVRHLDIGWWGRSYIVSETETDLI